MSADNGIYVLETKGPEYWVAHAQAIDNIYYDIATNTYKDDFIPQEAFRYFGDCQVFTDEKQALSYAHEEAEKYDVLEYGVSVINNPNQTFPQFSKEEMKLRDAWIDTLINRTRQERKAKEAAKRDLP